VNDSAGIETTTRQRLRAIFGGSIGNLIEWYDWYTYAAFAIYFAPSFFPKTDDPTVQLLNTAAVFGVGFLMRPIGGWVMGRYADRHGRKAALTLSVTLMCLGSLIIAVTPTYQTIGIAAPTLLVIARLIQGFSVGGEYGTSATYMSEIATPSSRGFYSGILYVTLIMGQLLALAVLMVLQFFLLDAHQLEAWGWRIPFVIGAIAAVAALYLRRNLVETDAFKNKAAAPEAGQLTLLLKHPREVLIVVGLTMGGTLFFYTFTTYMQKFLVNTVGLSKGESTLVSTANLFIFMLLQPLMGALSDRYGRRPMLIVFGVLALFGTVPLLSALAQAHDAWTAFFLIFIALAISSLYSSISAVVKAELFPVEIRALGVGLPYAITVSVFGGGAEYIALQFKVMGHEELFYWYVTGCVFISLLVYIFMRDPQRESRI
jgi:MHS family alpha-ketoglutarate permease-like MFS transporter